MESVNILCFGDSLTEGLSDWDMPMTPYADSMREWLQAAWPSTKLTVDVNGMSGDLVVQGLFPTRITSSCKSSR
jgi:lysophospholipase L1-like esterase